MNNDYVDFSQKKGTIANDDDDDFTDSDDRVWLGSVG